MSLEIPFGVKTVNPVKLEYWGGPYNSIAEALSTIPIEVRYLTMEVSILDSVNGNEKYWFKDSVLDSGLIKFASGGGGSGDVNIIEVIQKNGVALPVSGKTVNISVPTTAHDIGAFTSGETIQLINNYSGTTEVYIGPDTPPNSESLWVETDSDGNLVGEVYVGPSEPVNGQTLWVDTNVNNSFSFLTNNFSEISPDFESDFYKVNSNYSAGNAVSIFGYTNLPKFDTKRTLFVKNIASGDRIFVPNLNNQTSGGITYSFTRYNQSNIVVPTDKLVELVYTFLFTSDTTCLVIISYNIQQ
jgi:hypothetical protein